ncbi:polysialyltransferase family glycosyltransferase [Albidovulum aquaemixtae]|uniref:polysialyltransferase family glycosyltransferase n=1 Tax=Albidovulum aquaemixtae TaxID=1542388 RepID=UPI0011B1C8F9|nr:polysialyltransferase family glycosyltransferase [Defluviimonas aquaemixtae]
MPEAVQSPLADLCPNARLMFLYDRHMIARFANLPGWFPGIARRNLRLPMGGGPLPRLWCPQEVAGEHFDIGYIYHPGFFSAKVFAGLCRHVVMRESGMNNYIELSISPFKAVLRALTGLSPRRQVWGEERWIDAIEVEAPEALPSSVQHKARRMQFADVLDQAPSGLIREAVRLLAPAVGDIDLPAGSAILLTQPIDELGLCTPAEKREIYGYLAEALSRRGYRVFVKNHPREETYRLPGTDEMPHGFPIETWPLVHSRQFALAVALHSASLAQSSTKFAARKIQLLGGLDVDCASLDDWKRLIGESLERHFAHI